MLICASDYFAPISLFSVLVFIWFSGKTNAERILDQLSVIKSLTCLGCASLCVLILNMFFFRDRPFTTHEVNLLFYMPTDSSLPANSLASTLAISLPIINRHKRLGLIMISTSVFMGLARIYVGVHYPGDLIFASLIACGSLLLSRYIMTLIHSFFLKTVKVFRKMYMA